MQDQILATQISARSVLRVIRRTPRLPGKQRVCAGAANIELNCVHRDTRASSGITSPHYS